MTPKEKAKELVGKMHKNLYSDGIDDAKKCALICINELIKAMPFPEDEWYDERLEYLKEVEEEIEKL